MWAGFLLGLVMASSQVIFDECSDKVKLEQPSPDRRYVATVFERNCGATTSLATVVSLRKGGTPFVSGAKDYLFAIEGPLEVSVSWTDARTLVVEHAEAEVFRRRPRWHGVVLRYKSKKRW
jgi:hypothetical protein